MFDGQQSEAAQEHRHGRVKVGHVLHHLPRAALGVEKFKAAVVRLGDRLGHFVPGRQHLPVQPFASVRLVEAQPPFAAGYAHRAKPSVDGLEPQAHEAQRSP